LKKVGKGIFRNIGIFARIKISIMNINSLRPPLSNIQTELLKLFSADIPEKHLLELKEIIAKFLLEKARDKADAVWDKKGYSDEKLLKMLNEE
jgi:hypothetical protein